MGAVMGSNSSEDRIGSVCCWSREAGSLETNLKELTLRSRNDCREIPEFGELGFL